jgi:hypothetical protein
MFPPLCLHILCPGVVLLLTETSIHSSFSSLSWLGFGTNLQSQEQSCCSQWKWWMPLQNREKDRDKERKGLGAQENADMQETILRKRQKDGSWSDKKWIDDDEKGNDC